MIMGQRNFFTYILIRINFPMTSNKLQTLYHPGSRGSLGSSRLAMDSAVAEGGSACGVPSCFSFTLWSPTWHWSHQPQWGLSGWQTAALEGSWGWGRPLCCSLALAGRPSEGIWGGEKKNQQKHKKPKHIKIAPSRPKAGEEENPTLNIMSLLAMIPGHPQLVVSLPIFLS